MMLGREVINYFLKKSFFLNLLKSKEEENRINQLVGDQYGKNKFFKQEGTFINSLFPLIIPFFTEKIQYTIL